LSARLRQKIKAIQKLFQELDQETGALQRSTGLSCTTGCSRCCLSPQVETTVAEMLPMAAALHEQGRSSAFHQYLAQSCVDGDPICVVLHRKTPTGAQGSCSQYAERPGICRLFGFAGQRDKQGQARLSPCAQLKTHEGERIKQIQQDAQEGRLSIPLFYTLPARVALAADSESEPLLPINEALRQAIERVELDAAYHGSGSFLAELR